VIFRFDEAVPVDPDAAVHLPGDDRAVFRLRQPGGQGGVWTVVVKFFDRHLGTR
jgi:hypothetical protein